ncbi:MAG: translation initiation factor IF-2 subunit gamma [Candidatus Micrarchaeota archaeon]|nr:translation initiation factor IF-2 subunit gamma [Candidatus Micrarchaeota archaeon]
MGQAEVNIGLLGHVEHGKTSVVRCLTGVWTLVHSEEKRRGITIKLGYADAVFRKCPKCPEPEAFTIEEKCPKCGAESELLRRVSFLDAPGHETLMATAIAASTIIDGAILVIAANEECPQPQTLEHMMILDILGVKNIVIVQNKVDLVDKAKAKANYEQITSFVKGTIAEKAPIVPFVANYCLNMDVLIGEIQKHIPTPKRNLEASPRMYIARSFDVNRPGTEINKLVGGVVGGSLIQGELKCDDEIEIRPGVSKGEKDKEVYEAITSKVTALSAGKERLGSAVPGGLMAVGTRLDPSLTKADTLVGNILGKTGTLPETSNVIEIEFHILKRPDMENPPFKLNEPLVLGIGTSTSVGFVQKIKKNVMTVALKRPVCAEKKGKIAISRKVGQRWRLCGFGVLQ